MEDSAFDLFIRKHGEPIGRTLKPLNFCYPSGTPDGYNCLTREKVPAGTEVLLWGDKGTVTF